MDVESKNPTILLLGTDNGNKETIEENFEEYQIIKEDYCSSPKCGIKSIQVSKSIEKMSFSPIETSPNPYFKYYVIPIKEDNKNNNNKNDFSQSETNQTRNVEEKNHKNFNNNSYNDKNEFKERKSESDFGIVEKK